jgi:hypothetical protein
VPPIPTLLQDIAMRYFDLLQPETGLPYRLSLRVITMPGFPEMWEKVLVPLIYIEGKAVPMVTAERPILSALPPGHPFLMTGATRNYLLDHGWRLAE